MILETDVVGFHKPFSVVNVANLQPLFEHADFNWVRKPNDTRLLRPGPFEASVALTLEPPFESPRITQRRNEWLIEQYMREGSPSAHLSSGGVRSGLWMSFGHPDHLTENQWSAIETVAQRSVDPSSVVQRFSQLAQPLLQPKADEAVAECIARVLAFASEFGPLGEGGLVRWPLSGVAVEDKFLDEAMQLGLTPFEAAQEYPLDGDYADFSIEELEQLLAEELEVHKLGWNARLRYAEPVAYWLCESATMSAVLNLREQINAGGRVRKSSQIPEAHVVTRDGYLQVGVGKEDILRQLLGVDLIFLDVASIEDASTRLAARAARVGPRAVLDIRQNTRAEAGLALDAARVALMSFMDRKLSANVMVRSLNVEGQLVALRPRNLIGALYLMLSLDMLGLDGAPLRCDYRHCRKAIQHRSRRRRVNYCNDKCRDRERRERERDRLGI